MRVPAHRHIRAAEQRFQVAGAAAAANGKIMRLRACRAEGQPGRVVAPRSSMGRGTPILSVCGEEEVKGQVRWNVEEDHERVHRRLRLHQHLSSFFWRELR